MEAIINLINIKYRLITWLVLIFMITSLCGCGSKYTVSDETTMTNATIVDKSDTKTCLRFCSHTYSIIFNKDGQQISLTTDNPDMYNALQKGLIVDVTYTNNNFRIALIKLTKIEKNQ